MVITRAGIKPKKSQKCKNDLKNSKSAFKLYLLIIKA